MTKILIFLLNKFLISHIQAYNAGGGAYPAQPQVVYVPQQQTVYTTQPAIVYVLILSFSPASPISFLLLNPVDNK